VLIDHGCVDILLPPNAGATREGWHYLLEELCFGVSLSGPHPDAILNRFAMPAVNDYQGHIV